MNSNLRIVFVAFLVIAVVCGGFVALVAGPIWLAGRKIKRLNAILAQPENFKPAAIALARLCETDPKLLAGDMNQLPPDWTPTELGKLGPLEINIDHDEAFLSTTSGLAEFNGYRLDLDPQASDATNNAWVLTFDGMPPMSQTPAYSFSIPQNDGYTEEELVKDGWAELNRRKAAKAAGTDSALGDWSNPTQDMARLINQHRQVAERLGLIPSTQPATRP